MNEYIFPILTVVSAHLLIMISPGPNFLLSAKHGMSYTKQVFLLTTLGLATGSMIYLVMGFLGLTLIISQSALIYAIMKYIGAAYLTYIGIKALFVSQKLAGVGVLEKTINSNLQSVQAYRIGLFTNLSNPRAALYYLALFTSVILPETPIEAKMTIVVILPVLTWIWYSIVAMSFSMKWFQKIYNRFRKWVDISFGSLMIFLGVRLALSR